MTANKPSDSMANDWTKAVVDGATEDAGDQSSSVEDFDGIVDGPEDSGAADAEVVDAEVVEESDSTNENMNDETSDDETIDAEVVDDEVVDDEVADDEVVDAGTIAEGLAYEAAAEQGQGQPEPHPGHGADVAGVDAGVAEPEVLSVEALVVDLERVTVERDQYLDASRRLQAEFENYKKQIGKREVESRERANEQLVGELLPVLDACDGAVTNGAEEVVPMRTALLDALIKQGLDRVEPTDAAFDPVLHEAVMHEDADDVDGPVVAEVMRAGYLWKGRVLRPAMVRTRG